MPNFYLLRIFIFTFFAFSCKKPFDDEGLPSFTKGFSVPVQRGYIDEVSGIADSRINEGHLWAEQDGGNPTELHLLNYDGAYIKSIFLKGIENRDWEDMTWGTGPDKTSPYIYLADIGDNNEQYKHYNIYRFPEPLKSVDTVSSIEKITFQYPDGAHDAEAMFIENRTCDIYLVTKRDVYSIIYKIPFPQSTVSINTAVKLFALSFSGAVGAAISADQKEIIIKTYTHIYYWKINQGENLGDALKKTPKELEYEVEPQGEAICFKKDGSGFFTISEKGLSSAVRLNFYKRN